MPDWDCVCGYGADDAYGEEEWCASERMGSDNEGSSISSTPSNRRQGNFSEEEFRVIEFLIHTGYGWGKFAQSVYKQGNCSPAQLDTMQRMESRIRNHRRR